ncbi:2-hydroxychromene-2-carboxylate isomerase [Bradyrhizobium sp. USDA 4486]
MTLSVELFYSYRSPFSYLALPKTLRLVEQYDLAVNLRPVYLHGLSKRLVLRDDRSAVSSG